MPGRSREIEREYALSSYRTAECAVNYMRGISTRKEVSLDDVYRSYRRYHDNLKKQTKDNSYTFRQWCDRYSNKYVIV